MLLSLLASRTGRLSCLHQATLPIVPSAPDPALVLMCLEVEAIFLRCCVPRPLIYCLFVGLRCFRLPRFNPSPRKPFGFIQASFWLSAGVPILGRSWTEWPSVGPWVDLSTFKITEGCLLWGASFFFKSTAFSPRCLRDSYTL